MGIQISCLFQLSTKHLGDAGSHPLSGASEIEASTLDNSREDLEHCMWNPRYAGS